MSASAGLSAAKRRRGGVASRAPPSNVPQTIQEVENEPVDQKSLLLKHDFTIFQMEQAIGHLLSIVNETANAPTTDSTNGALLSQLSSDFAAYREENKSGNNRITNLQKGNAFIQKINEIISCNHHNNIFYNIIMNLILKLLIFCIVLFIYIHVCFLSENMR